MYKMFVNLLAEVIFKECQGYMKNSPNSFAQYFDDESNNKDGPLALLRGIQQCYIDIQSLCLGY